MSENIKRSVIYFTTAKEVWQHLERRFTVSKGSHKYRLSKAVFDTKQNGSTVSDYYTKMYSLWEELENLNDFSRAVWVYLLKHKNDAVQVLKGFTNYVKTQFESKIKQVRSDNAREFIEGKFRELFIEQGIQHQTSCVNTPQQNGKAERRHRNLLETACAPTQSIYTSFPKLSTLFHHLHSHQISHCRLLH